MEGYLAEYFNGFGDALPPVGLYDRILRDVESPLITAALGFMVANRRLRREEADMIAEHGDAYVAYMHSTDRMFPNLW